VLRSLSTVWTEVQPVEDVRALCSREPVAEPPLARSRLPLQLLAAIVWTGGRPDGDAFVCLDLRLREAARIEGFHLLLPTSVIDSTPRAH
jgi:hypothetical protein